jgi:23S rRNA (guanosine2251-2'-O)-methyltransferase
MPVLEALLDERAVVAKVVVARTARGEAIDRILEAAAERGLRVERADAHRVTRISRNGRHDQGVVADVASPGLVELDDWLGSHPGPAHLLVLDGVTNPANVGMVIRTAVAAGLDGVVLPRAGCPDVGPLVVKASAGVALAATVLRAATAADAAHHLHGAGIDVVGLAAGAADSLWDVAVPPRAALVLGNETDGVSPAVAAAVDRWCSIPVAAGVDSLNVAATAAVVAFELARRRRPPAGGAGLTA